MSIVQRSVWIDDDGSGTTGTIVNNARLQGDVYDRIDEVLARLDTLYVATGPISVHAAAGSVTLRTAGVARLTVLATGQVQLGADLTFGADGTINIGTNLVRPNILYVRNGVVLPVGADKYVTG